MWNDRLRFSERVTTDWAALDSEQKDIVRVALEHLDEDPILGVPLFEPLRGIWSYRPGNFRILYRIAPEARTILVLAIGQVGRESA